jgi:plastocyanin
VRPPSWADLLARARPCPPYAVGRAGRPRSSDSQSDGAAGFELCRRPTLLRRDRGGLCCTSAVFLLALSTGHKVGLGVSGAVFILFALTSAVLLPRYRPHFPSDALWAFIVVALALFGGMLAAVVVFGAEPKVARKSAHATAQPTVSSPQPATTVQVSEKEFKIILASTTLKAGQITFHVKNVGTVPHDLVIAGTSDRTKLISPAQTATLTAQLKPGRYELYCSVAGHKQAGMDEKIQVT